MSTLVFVLDVERIKIDFLSFIHILHHVRSNVNPVSMLCVI